MNCDIVDLVTLQTELISTKSADNRTGAQPQSVQSSFYFLVKPTMTSRNYSATQ